MTRINYYLGPKEQIKSSELYLYENKDYIAEVKYDGAFCICETDANGYIINLISRTGIQFSPDSRKGLSGIKLNISNSILAGELETASQVATKNYKKLGYRRLFIFDAINIMGKDIRELPYIKRRQLLELSFTNLVPEMLANRVKLIEKRENGFKKFFDEIISCGGEGIVLKKRDSLYKSSTSDGKTESWIRCKDLNTVDFIVMGVGKSKGRSDNLRLGLMRFGKLEHIQSISIPKGYLANDLIGRTVECVGMEIMDSGALRSARFNRVRDDKL